MKINIKKTFICPLLEVKKEILSSFYMNNFKDKFLFINKNWEWLYRVNFKKKIYPLALFVDKKMIGHSGHMPFEFLINKKKYISSWFVDFKIDPKFQNQGYGTYLVQEWKKKIQIGFAFCNNKSLRVFKKNKWNHDKNFFMFSLFINPFDYFKLGKFLPDKVKYILNNSFSIFFKRINKFKKQKIIFHTINYKNFRLINKKENLNYFKWRILNSPNFENYKIVSLEDKKYFFLLRVNKKRNIKYLEILLFSENIDSNYFRNFVLNLHSWSYKRNYCFLKILLKKEVVKKINIITSIKKKLNFVFFLKNNLKKKDFEKNIPNFQLIDSDFEFTGN